MLDSHWLAELSLLIGAFLVFGLSAYLTVLVGSRLFKNKNR